MATAQPPSQRATDLELLGTTEKPSPERDGYIKLFFANLLKKFRKTNARLHSIGNNRINTYTDSFGNTSGQ